MEDSVRKQILQDIGSDIKEILYGYIKAQSFTYSEKEREAEAFFMDYFSQKPYFKENPECFGTWPIEGDPLSRSVCYAMVRGKGPKTVVFVHHQDVVTVEDFKMLSPLAFSPDELAIELKKIADTLQDEAREDLLTDGYLFGRGVCDMKGGGAIQMALLSRYSQLETFTGNVIIIAVPDEENLSAGMRSAVVLLDDLKKKYGLEYEMMINSEPHQRKDPDKGVFSLGSVGKLMPFFYVRGSLAHAGKVFEGFNPANLMSAIVRKTELNMDLSDVVGKEAAPPPTWLYLRDDKDNYDVSMPLAMWGCLSVLTLNQNPASLMTKIRDICEKAFDEILADMNRSYHHFLTVTGRETTDLPWSRKVVDFSQLYEEAKEDYGEPFETAYKKQYAELVKKMQRGESSLIECNFELVEFIFNYIKDLSPKVVFGLIPPYYPNVTNQYLENLSPVVKDIAEILNGFTKKTYGQQYVTEHFYTGISDLSYTSVKDSSGITKALCDSMPLYGDFYQVPVAVIEKLSMPCINIGPWGKDFHKLTERVLKEDLYERTPRILQKAVEVLLEDGEETC